MTRKRDNEQLAMPGLTTTAAPPPETPAPAPAATVAPNVTVIPLQPAPTDELKEAEPLTKALQVRAAEVTVSDQASYDDAMAFLVEVKTQLDDLEKRRLRYTEPLNESLRKINADARALREPLEKARGEVQTRALAWRRKENDRAAEEKRKADEARRKAEADKEKAEADRKKADSDYAAAEAARRKAELDAEFAATPEEKSKAIAQGLEATQAGIRAGSTAYRAREEATRAVEAQRAAAVTALAVEAPKRKVSAGGGAATPRKVWLFRVDDVAKLPDKYKMANEKAIRADVCHENGARDIPGCTIWDEEDLSIQGRKR